MKQNPEQLRMFTDPFGREVINPQKITHLLVQGELQRQIEEDLGVKIKPETLVKAAANLKLRQTQPESYNLVQARLNLCLN